MSERKEDWNYTSAAHLNPSVQPGLEELFLSLVREEGERLRVCDLGCGNGKLAGRLAGMGHQVVGIDSSASGIDVAQASGHSVNATFICAEIDESLPTALGAGQFDLVVSSDVIEHLYRPASLPRVAYALLRPGGSLIVGTPYHGYLKNLAISLAGEWDAHHGVHWDGGHIKFFSVASLGAMLRAAGFSSLRFSYYGRAPYLWKNMVCKAVKPG